MRCLKCTAVEILAVLEELQFMRNLEHYLFSWSCLSAFSVPLIPNTQIYGK